MNIDTSIFKAYDIRGIYPESLDEELAYAIGRAYAKLLKDENPGKILKIAVTNDMRMSAPKLKPKLVQGLLDSGIEVHDYGLASTPTFYFIVGFEDLDGGIQVSASHNPKEYNGFKMVRAKSVPVSGDRGIYSMKDWIVNDELPKVLEKGILVKEKEMAATAVVEELKEWKVDNKIIKPFKIVVDTANAMAILDIREIFRDLPCKLILLNEKLDGTFPAHLADPLDPENLKQAREAVVGEKADLAIVTDGDGDRYFFLDEKGQEIRQEILRGIMAQIALKDYPGAKVGYDIRPGRITKDMILEAGGQPFVTKVGHSLIKQKMIEEDSVFGGESSGHYFYKFSFGTFEAPAVLTLKLLEYLSKQDKPFSEIIKPHQKYFHSGEINSEVEDKEGAMERLALNYKDANEISHLDGVTIEFDDFWFNVRPSNTESKLRLNLEAISKIVMEKRRDEVLKVIRS